MLFAAIRGSDMGTCCFDYEEPTVHREEFRKAAKEYKCCECGSEINIGDTYEHVTQLYEGTWATYRTCEPCADLRESLSEVSCPYYQGLAECYTEWLTEGPNTVMTVNPGSHAAKLVPDYFLQDKPE